MGETQCGQRDIRGSLTSCRLPPSTPVMRRARVFIFVSKRGATTRTMCCGSPSVTFGWLGGVVVNFAFASLVVWGAATNWPVGMAFSAVYTAALFWFSAYLRKNFAEKVEGLRRATDVLLLVAVFGVGVTTLFLPVNLIARASLAALALPANTTTPPFRLVSRSGRPMISTPLWPTTLHPTPWNRACFSDRMAPMLARSTSMVSRALSPEVSVVIMGASETPLFSSNRRTAACVSWHLRRETAESTRLPGESSSYARWTMALLYSLRI